MERQINNIDDDATHFNPEIDYYFISVLIGNSKLPKWYRKPFMTKDMVLDFLMNEFHSDYEDIVKIEIFEEKTLQEKIYLKGNDENYYETNLREFLFGKNYRSESDFYAKSTTPGAEFSWRKFR